MIPKFRAWEPYYKQMFANDQIIIWNGNVYVNDAGKITVDSMRGWSIDDKYLMQSTGLFDKNGVEIFEGDVVAIGDATFIVGHHQTGGATIRAIEDNVERFHNFGTINELEEELKDVSEIPEIIGNIYQHPHLLEVNNES